MATVYIFFKTLFVFSFLHHCCRAHCALIFLRPFFSRVLSTSRELFMILVLNPVDTFDKREAREMGFFPFLHAHFILIWRQCAHLCPYIFFYSAHFFQKIIDSSQYAYDAHIIFFFILKLDITTRTLFLAARSSLLSLLCPLYNIRFSVLNSLLAARCLVLSACCSLLANCSQNL